MCPPTVYFNRVPLTLTDVLYIPILLPSSLPPLPQDFDEEEMSVLQQVRSALDGLGLQPRVQPRVQPRIQDRIQDRILPRQLTPQVLSPPVLPPLPSSTTSAVSVSKRLNFFF